MRKTEARTCCECCEFVVMGELWGVCAKCQGYVRKCERTCGEFKEIKKEEEKEEYGNN